MDNRVFDRIEKKYLINRAQKKILLSTIKKQMKKDKYYKSDVINLYFDNDNFDLIVQSIDQPDFKEKIRARSYDGYDGVFLEIKTKLRAKNDENKGYKRRVMITHDDFDEFLRHNFSLEQLAARDIEKNNDIQIAREIDYLVERFNLKPKLLVVYNRESYKGEDGLRITFDDKLRYRSDNLSLFSEKDDKMFFNDMKSLIMEIKAHGAFPLWLVKLLSENHLYSQRFSKVGSIYTKLRKEQNV